MRTPRLAALAIASAAAGSLLVVTGPAAAQVRPQALETISVAVDHTNQAGWWSPLDEADGYTYLAYNTDVLSNVSVHNVWITRRDSAGNYLRGCLPNIYGFCRDFRDDLGHNQPSIAIDGHGYIHIFTAMHGDNWIYYRSSRPHDPTTMVDRSSQMADQGARVTYPNIARAPNGDLWLIARVYHSNAGQAGRLYHWNNATNTWRRPASFAYQDSRAVYPDDVQVTPNGDVHIAWEWSRNPANATRHEGSYLRYRPSANAFYVANGTRVTAPVTTATPGLIYQPLAAGESYSGGRVGVQSAKLALYQRGTAWVPTIAYRYQEYGTSIYKVRRARWTGAAWSREVLYNGPSDTSAAIDTTHDGSTARVYYSLTSGGGTARMAQTSGGGVWTHTTVSDGAPVQRLSVRMRAGGTDVLYLCAPTELSSRRGVLYLSTIAR